MTDQRTPTEKAVLDLVQAVTTLTYAVDRIADDFDEETGALLGGVLLCARDAREHINSQELPTITGDEPIVPHIVRVELREDQAALLLGELTRLWICEVDEGSDTRAVRLNELLEATRNALNAR